MSSNRLGSEKSPYLLQHRNNPVHWYPWGEEAFEVARREDRPVFLSVGYSTCHWCHVMERESFEDPEVAAVLNERFVSIKVDREERPDVDEIYMTAIHAMGQRGGWPMSVWLTPDGRPFYGGTYFPRDVFIETLRGLSEAWRRDRGRIDDVGRQLASVLAASTPAGGDEAPGERDLAAFHASARAGFDTVLGGRRGAPKFPPAYDLRLMLRIHRRSGSAGALRIVTTTLDAMAAGGICDHLGGGFHRYSVDDRWLVPHFEKMLYDQASLLSAYTEAWQQTGEEEYERVAREIAGYVLREMTHPDGGFFSAEDADSEGEEGKFYVWTPREVSALLAPEEAAAVTEAFGVTERGNFEGGTSILHLQAGHRRTGRSPVLGRAMEKLLEARSRRVRPHLDDKILTSWNGLMIAALARAAVAWKEGRYGEAAAAAARFVLDNIRTPEGRPLRRWRDGEARFIGTLDDSAFLIDALIELYQFDFDAVWIDEALRLQELQNRHHGEGGPYYFTDGTDGTLLARTINLSDNVTPAGNSIAALNLLRLTDLTGDPSHARRAREILVGAGDAIRRMPAAFPQLLAAVDYAQGIGREIALVGPPSDARTRRLLDALREGFHPARVIALGEEGSTAPPLLSRKTMIDRAPSAYVCDGGACRAPTSDPAEAARLGGEAAPLPLGD